MKRSPEQLKTENAILKAQLKDKKEAEKYSRLQHDLGFVLASTNSTEEALKQVLKYVLKIKEIEGAGIYLINQETGKLEFSLSSGLPAGFIEQVINHGCFQSPEYKRSLQKGIPVYKKCSNLVMGSKIFEQEKLLRIGVIPIKYGNSIIGSFNIGSRSAKELGKKTKTFLETIAAQMGGTLWRIKAREKLRTSEACWDFALESFGDGIWYWDIKTGKISYSKQCLKITSYNKNDVSGTIEGWRTVVHPEDVDNVFRNIEAHLKGEADIIKIEYRILCKDGSYKWILDRGKVISRDQNGNPEGAIGISIDISSQKQIENSLASALKKEKELNELKTQFVSMASHEFRTPLGTMLIAADMLLTYWDRLSKQDIQNKIERIRTNIQFLKNIIEKTLNLNHLESGKLQFIPVETELNDFLKEIIEGISPESRYRINYKGTNAPMNFKIDKQMMKEVIINVLTNSMKYSEPGTAIDVKLIENNNRINIQVSDKGIGIPETEKEYIFEAFRRCSNVTGIRGTGLGLTLSRKFVRLHKGKITFESKINEGTTFFIDLPRILS